jgi:hypothetical protein
MGTLRHKERRLLVGRKTIKRGLGKKTLAGKNFRLADEIDYIRSHAAAYDS